MKTPDQKATYPPKEERMDKNPEKKESLYPFLQILREMVEKFRSLEQEAKVALYEKGDTEAHDQKHKEGAQLLIDLPNRLSNVETIYPEIKQKIIEDVRWFALSAKEALRYGVPPYGLLMPMGSKIGDKNDLEKYIASLENE